MKAEVGSPAIVLFSRRVLSTALQGQQLQPGLEPVHGDVDTYAPVFKAFVPVVLSVKDAQKLSRCWRVPSARKNFWRKRTWPEAVVLWLHDPT